MRALTLYEPYATAIALLLKGIETRGHLLTGVKTLIGARIAIHAGLTVEAHAPLLPRGVQMQCGHVVATAKLAWVGQVVGYVGATSVSVDIIGGDALQVPVDDWGDFTLGRWLYKFVDVRPLTPLVPARGMQGLWWWEGGRRRCVSCGGALPPDPDGLPGRCKPCAAQELGKRL